MAATEGNKSVRKVSKRASVKTSPVYASPINSTEKPMENSSPVRSSLPKMSFPKNYIPVLVVLLIIASFALGMLIDRVMVLEKGGNNNNSAAQAAAQQPNQAAQGTQPGQKVDVAAGHFPVKGNKDAKVTVIEFADFRCPFCEQFFSQVEPQLIKDYVDTGKVKFAFRSFAFLGPASILASNAAECANDQNKFWDFYDYMYKNQPPESDTSMYTNDKLTSIAGDLGMNTDQFSSCITSTKFDKNVSGDLADGQKAGVSGTPTFFVNGLALVGAQPYTAFKTAIDAELAK